MTKRSILWVPFVVLIYTCSLLQFRNLWRSIVPLAPRPLFQSNTTSDLHNERQQFIVGMAQHAWSGYMHVAAGHDEMKPLSGTHSDRWGRIGITAIDSMDTLLLMGLEKEFHQARQLVKQIHIEKGTQLSPFETVIRHVGAAVAVYAVTADEELLSLAKKIADGLLPAYEGPYALPRHRAPFGMTSGDGPYDAILSEAGSNQLEFRFLSALTGDDKYERTANALTQLIFDARAAGWPANESWYKPNAPRMPHRGLFPSFVSPEGKFSGATGVASFLDSFYEYVLKQWILFGKQDEGLRVLYTDMVEGMLLHLVKYHNETQQAMLGYHGFGYFSSMDHLSCFAPGMLVLGLMHGAHREGDDVSTSAADVAAVAADLARTCYTLYQNSPSGLAADVVEVPPPYAPRTSSVALEGTPFMIRNPKYLLRPETIESLFYLYRFTHDEQYRDWGWSIAMAIETHCRTPHGYASVGDVRRNPPLLQDSEESFFIAETLKYLYLLFSDDDVLPLDEWVLTTEAHPLPIFSNRD